jgi:hypothetical protein
VYVCVKERNEKNLSFFCLRTFQRKHFEWKFFMVTENHYL